MSLRNLLFGLVILCSGCASYVTPGGSVNLADINRADIAEAASRKPSPNFPSRLAVARVQAPQYKSYTSTSYGSGPFSVVTTQELLTEDQIESISKWPSVAGVAPINRLLLPPSLNSLDDLRVSAAQVQADVLLIYTIDTSFRVQGRTYAPLSPLSLGIVPDRDAHITSTASALFTDVRTGFVYGLSEATANATGLTNVWGSTDTVDRKRLEAEREAFALLIPQMEKTWAGIAKQYAK
ncbi:hypothetical protein DNFV4_03779 [Nitrospira tepida]|uniref:Lipoprotein n=1 Tax=Nitrospira tepida TaxID=2973512 RepID=A0AA86N260_9BACT|nr:hypothetical protein [Nitrospira tepida]CAI4033343.1 hypothetical protein DNFV4_03779 [Nitrospira tepida]